ncbi:MAG: shikimate dehydrogenase [Spirochaetales bacterium]|nr:shikimate dehydrogenase [Spirochaetales bacterium]
MKKSQLCLVCTSKTIQENIENIEKYKDRIDCIELRADFLSPEEQSVLDKFPAFTNLPVILTIRRKSDGGVFKGTEQERRQLLKQGSRGDYAYIDLETDFRDEELEASLKSRNIKIIRSFHDLESVPGNLVKRVKKIAENKNEIPKAAVTPKSTSDLLAFFEACRELSHTEKIIIGMGEFGVTTRILANKTGSMISYCSVPGQSAAPGHLDPITMTTLYRFHRIGKHTKIYGIIGNPIHHSSSPLIHNRGLRDLMIDAVYVPFLTDDVKSFFEIANLLSIEGFSVTIPHKEEVIRHLKKTDQHIEAVGACNTVVHRGNHYIGTNTDIEGFISPLYTYFSPDEMKSMKATVIGAGGASRACVYALRKAGMTVLILNRTPAKAKKLSEEFDTQWGPLDETGFSRMKNFCDLIIQTTSVGMVPKSEQDPLAAYKFAGNEFVYDLIYNPKLTRLLERALSAGCKVLNGEEMLVAQAHLQFKLFTGRESLFKNNYLSDFMRTEIPEM